MKIRRFDKKDAAAILKIQDANPSAARWLASDYERLADDPGGLVLVAELETMTPPKPMGFAAFHRIAEEAELRNIAIAPEHLHQGVGRALLVEAARMLFQASVRRIFLEVRPSNTAALGLYYAVGFALHSRRSNYYQNPREDALVLVRQLFPTVG